MNTVEEIESGVPKPSELLRRALELLGPNGERWTKGRYKVVPGAEEEYPDGAYCSSGAIEEINTINQDKAKQYLREAIWASIYTTDGIINFNDAKIRKFPEVKATFEAAIALAIKEGR